jgi:hypothetical protein
MTHFQYLNSDDALIENTLTAWDAYSRSLTEFAANPNPPEWEPLPPSWPPMAPGARYASPEVERPGRHWPEGWEFLRVPGHQGRPGTPWSTAATQDDLERGSEMGTDDMDGDTIVPDDFRPDSPHPEMRTAVEADDDVSDTETLCEEAPKRLDDAGPLYRLRLENREVKDPSTVEVRRAIQADKARLSAVLTRFRQVQKLMNRDTSPDTKMVYL